MNQQDAQLLTNNLYFSLFCSTCFGRTIRPSSGAPSSKLHHAFGTLVQASLTSTVVATCSNEILGYKEFYTILHVSKSGEAQIC